MSAGLVATESYGNTVVPDTANTSITNPTGGSNKVLAVGSATTKRVTERIDWQSEGTTAATVVYIFLYDTGSGKSVLKFYIVIPAKTVTLTDNPPSVPPFGGFDCNVELPDNTWELIVTVRDSQATRISQHTRGYS